MAAAFPDSLDGAGLLAALRGQFARDWPSLSPETHQRAAQVYRAALERALAARCKQILPVLFAKVERILKI